MKTPISLIILTLSAALQAASVNDGSILSSSTEGVVPQDSLTLIAPTTDSTIVEIDPLTPVTAEGVVLPPPPLSPTATVPAPPTSVPESVGAIFVALFGFVLMLRRR